MTSLADFAHIADDEPGVEVVGWVMMRPRELDTSSAWGPTPIADPFTCTHVATVCGACEGSWSHDYVVDLDAAHGPMLRTMIDTARGGTSVAEAIEGVYRALAAVRARMTDTYGDANTTRVARDRVARMIDEADHAYMGIRDAHEAMRVPAPDDYRAPMIFG